MDPLLKETFLVSYRKQKNLAGDLVVTMIKEVVKFIRTDFYQQILQLMDDTKIKQSLIREANKPIEGSNYGSKLMLDLTSQSVFVPS